MRAKRRGAATPVKCNIRSRFHQIFLLSGCWQSVKRKSDWSALRVAFCPPDCFHEWAFPSAHKHPVRLKSNKWLAVLCAWTSSSDFTVLFRTIIISGFYGHVCRLRPWEIFHFLCFLGTGNTGNNRTTRYTKSNQFMARPMQWVQRERKSAAFCLHINSLVARCDVFAPGKQNWANENRKIINAYQPCEGPALFVPRPSNWMASICRISVRRVSMQQFP